MDCVVWIVEYGLSHCHRREYHQYIRQIDFLNSEIQFEPFEYFIAHFPLMSCSQVFSSLFGISGNRRENFRSPTLHYSQVLHVRCCCFLSFDSLSIFFFFIHSLRLCRSIILTCSATTATTTKYPNR